MVATFAGTWAVALFRSLVSVARAAKYRFVPRCNPESVSCQHGPTDSVTDQITELGRARKPWQMHRVRLVCLFCLFGFLVSPFVYAFAPVSFLSSFVKPHCVYVVYDPFGKKLSLARFGLPSEHLEQPHDSARDRDADEADKTTPLPEMLKPQNRVATRDELRHHVQKCLEQFPNQPYVYVVQKVVRRQLGDHDEVVQAVVLKVENPTFDRRRLRHFRIGGCS